MPVTSDEFRAALSRFPSGVTVVTSRDGEGRFHGITVSAFCSVSLDPRRVLICVEKTTGSHEALETSKLFVVNVLSSGQQDISERFASLTENKFEGLDIETTIDGLPVLLGCIATLECSITAAYDGGDHSIFVGEVEKVSAVDGDPLLYFRGDYRSISA